MKNLNQLTTLKHNTVIVEYQGEKYEASYIDLLWLQVEVSKGCIKPSQVKIFESIEGKEVINPIREDGCFEEDFKGNILDLPTELLMKLL